MPSVSFDPNYGMRSDQTADEAAAERMREFLFRQQLAAQQKAQADKALSAQERIAQMAEEGANNRLGQSLANNVLTGGTFSDKTAAGMGMEKLRTQGQRDIAQIGIAPAMGGLDLARQAQARAFNKEDNSPDTIISNAVAQQLRGALGQPSPAPSIGAVPKVGAPGAQMPYGGQGGMPSKGGSYDTDKDGGGPLDADTDGDQAPGVKPRMNKPGFNGNQPGANKYQYDDKSSADMQSMLDQIKANSTVDPKRIAQAQAMKDNSDRQLAMRMALRKELGMPVPAAAEPSPAVAASTATTAKPNTDLAERFLDAKYGPSAKSVDERNDRNMRRSKFWDMAMSGNPQMRAAGMAGLDSMNEPLPAAFANIPTTQDPEISKKLDEIFTSRLKDFATRDTAMSPWQRAVADAAAYGAGGATVGAGIGFIGGPFAPVTSGAGALIGGGLGTIGGAIHGLSSGRSDPSQSELNALVDSTKKSIDDLASRTGDRKTAREIVLGQIQQQLDGLNINRDTIGADKLNQFLNSIESIQ